MSNFDELLSEDKEYVLNLPYHLAKAGMVDDLHEILTEFTFLDHKVSQKANSQLLIEDYELALGSDIKVPEVQKNNLKLIQGALQLSASILAQDKTQLASQLIGRLLGFDSPEIQKMLADAKEWKGANWLCPITASLTPPNTPLSGVLTGHTDKINAVAITPDGRLGVSASNDETLKVWDLQAREELFTLRGHRDKVSSVAITSDGKRAVSGSRDGTVKIWELKTGQEERTILAGASEKNLTLSAGIFSYDEVNAVAITPDTTQIIAASSPQGVLIKLNAEEFSSPCNLRIWNLQTRNLEVSLKGHEGAVTAIAITSDGKYMASASLDKTLKIWDLNTKKEKSTLRGHTKAVLTVGISPDGEKIVSASADKTIKIWHLPTGKELKTLKGFFLLEVKSIAISPNGRHVIVGGIGEIKIFDLELGLEIASIPDPNLNVSDIAVVSNGQEVIVASGNTLRILYLQRTKNSSRLRESQGHTQAINAITTTPDGNYLISASNDKTLKIWDLKNGSDLHTLSGHTDYVSMVAVTHDGKKILSAASPTLKLGEEKEIPDDNSLRVWNIEDGKEIDVLQGHRNTITGLVISNENQAVTVSSDNTLKVWNLEDEVEVFTLQGNARTKIQWQQDLQYIRRYLLNFLLYLKNSLFLNTLFVFVWFLDLLTGNRGQGISARANLHKKANWILSRYNKPNSGLTKVAVSVSANRRIAVSASSEGSLKVWDLTDRKALYSLRGHTKSITDLTILSDGKTCISASEDGMLKIWDIELGRYIHTLSGHKDKISLIAVTDDGSKVISASDDYTLKIWDIQSRLELHTLSGHIQPINAIAINGDYLVSVASDNTLRVWSIGMGVLLASFYGDEAFQTCSITPNQEMIIATNSQKIHFLCFINLGKRNDIKLNNSLYKKNFSLDPTDIDSMDMLDQHTSRLWQFIKIWSRTIWQSETQNKDRIKQCEESLRIIDEINSLDGVANDQFWKVSSDRAFFLTEIASALIDNLEDSPDKIERAIEILNEALTFIPKDPEAGIPETYNWHQKLEFQQHRSRKAEVMYALSRAYMLRQTGNSVENLKQVIVTLEQAELFFDQKSNFPKWLEIQYSLFEVYQKLYEQEATSEYLYKVIETGKSLSNVPRRKLKRI